MRVLLADESHTMRGIVRRALESLGVRITTEASDGPQAIEMFKASRGFDLVVTDWDMPVKSGGELIHEIRALDPEVPIGHNEIETAARFEHLNGLRAIG